jgi:type I restriction enzyme S subunit
LPYPVYGSNGVIGHAAETNADASSIVIGRVGSYCGSLQFSKQRCWVTDNAIRATALDDNDSRFLFYLLTTLSLNNWRAGSGQPLLNQVILSRIPAVAPLPNEQRAIAHILGTLDDKIELNRRMNETLEAMARALFKSWFVDFDPVRAKAEGRDPGLPQLLADSFPDSFEDSELGEIPKGWGVKQLSEMTTLITKGTTPTQSDTYTDDEADGGINYVRVNAIDEDGSILFDKLTTISESVHLGVLKRSVLQASDVLYTIAGTIGRTTIVEESLLPANTNQAVAIVRPKQAISAAFLVMTMRAAAFREELHSNVVQAVQANLSLGMLSRARIVVPPKDTLLQLFVPIADLTTRVSSTRTESRTLAALRDTLLPKLISGELRVDHAEKVVAGAV